MTHRTIRPLLAATILGPTVAGLGFAGLAFAGTAQASAAPKPLAFTIQDSTIDSQGGSVGDAQVTAGLIAATPFGNGVESIHDKVTSVSATEITLKGVLKVYEDGGTLSGPITIHVFPQPDGSAKGQGSGAFTHGTGRFAGLTARYSFTGAETADSSVFISHATGSYTR